MSLRHRLRTKATILWEQLADSRRRRKLRGYGSLAPAIGQDLDAPLTQGW